MKTLTHNYGEINTVRDKSWPLKNDRQMTRYFLLITRVSIVTGRVSAVVAPKAQISVLTFVLFCGQIMSVQKFTDYVMFLSSENT